jgi:hypothetical protein
MKEKKSNERPKIDRTIDHNPLFNKLLNHVDVFNDRKEERKYYA